MKRNILWITLAAFLAACGSEQSIKEESETLYYFSSDGVVRVKVVVLTSHPNWKAQEAKANMAKSYKVVAGVTQGILGWGLRFSHRAEGKPIPSSSCVVTIEAGESRFDNNCDWMDPHRKRHPVAPQPVGRYIHRIMT